MCAGPANGIVDGMTAVEGPDPASQVRPGVGLFGRDRELSDADEALGLAATGTPQVLLVGGDAGIGKTTLATAVSERARACGFTVLTGHCLDVDHGAALRPVREALRGAVLNRPDDELPPVTRRLADYLRGTSDGGPLDTLGLVTAELAAEAPLLLLLEDMHAADRATRELAVSLAHTATGPFVLVLTFRNDELTRRHPFRRALVELGRSPAARRLELGVLDRDGIAGIVEARTGRRDPALVGALLARSEGNPLYVEELVAAGTDGLPAALSDLLLARVDALSTPARDLLRFASVHGSRLDVPSWGRSQAFPLPSWMHASGRRRTRTSCAPTASTWTSATGSCARRCTTTCCPASGPARTQPRRRPWSACRKAAGGWPTSAGWRTTGTPPTTSRRRTRRPCARGSRRSNGAGRRRSSTSGGPWRSTSRSRTRTPTSQARRTCCG